ncbi:conserved hypothetical protein [Coccidioides posadasii str. Silveira]|uniref:Uncharacterized protein n=2 Tax=Coccidioides posadasii (strain RMSCC 757 / Silveira) TaxID=443226 RepID=E9DEH4_COCPS|nr:conserved hypothetical protein [Coccidioides posadasii str. Silveira]
MEYISTPMTHPVVQPCIAELLRTGYHPPELILRVERVIEVPIILASRQFIGDTGPSVSCSLAVPGSSEEERIPTRKTYRIFLSDGELVIQALLKRELHYFVSTGEVVPGAVLGLERFEIKKAERVSSADVHAKDKSESLGQIVFLAVERFRAVDGRLRPEPKIGEIQIGMPILKVKMVAKKRDRDELDASEPLRQKNARLPDPDQKSDTSKDTSPPPTAQVQDRICKTEEFYESILDDTEMLASGFLLEDTREQSPGLSARASTCGAAEGIRPRTPGAADLTMFPFESTWLPPTKSQAKTPNAHAQPIRSLSITRPLNLFLVHELLYPLRALPKRNYIVDVFGVVSWTSPNTITRRNMPPKRDLRIVDSSFTSHPQRNQHPSNTKLELGISVSVFVDAERFCPPVGTVALFRSLKTHEWEGISLNAYEKDCGGGKEWFICDKRKLEDAGYDVVGMRKWWEQWDAERKKKLEEDRRRFEEVEANKPSS